MATNNIFRSLYDYGSYMYIKSKIHTPLEEAVHEINQRRSDDRLQAEIAKFLQNDIPPHFVTDTPIFYFSRYLATPDYETLLFVNQVKKYNYPIVIGEDTTDILTSHSSLKRNLLKLPVIVGHSRSGKPILQYYRIGDLNAEQGKQLQNVSLCDGSPLVAFHRSLATKLLPKNVTCVEESEWVDRHNRGDLVKLYESMLALLITHGIMLEHYEPCEVDFLQETVLPAFKKTKARFGHAPLITPLQQTTLMELDDPNSYPATVISDVAAQTERCSKTT